METVFVCANCGGKNIQGKAWCNYNTGKLIDWCANEDDDFWCEDCQEHCEVESEDDYNANK